MNVLRRLTKAQRALALGVVVLVVGAVTVAAIALTRHSGHRGSPTIGVRTTASPAPPSPGTPAASNPAPPAGTPKQSASPSPAASSPTACGQTPCVARTPSPTTAPSCPRNAMCIPEGTCPDTCTPSCPPNAMCVSPKGTGVLTLGDSANGTTVTISPGERIQVVLGSTYWTFDPSSSAAVLVAQGSQQTSPGSSCPPYPGSGCGTATQVYTAEAQGTAVVSAHRTSCGEALPCTGSQGSFKLTVVVRTS